MAWESVEVEPHLEGARVEMRLHPQPGPAEDVQHRCVLGQDVGREAGDAVLSAVRDRALLERRSEAGALSGSTMQATSAMPLEGSTKQQLVPTMRSASRSPTTAANAISWS
jgi:hypothetical protein